MVCSPPVSSIHEISLARILEEVATSFSKGSSQPRDQNLISCIGRWVFVFVFVFYHWATREARMRINVHKYVANVLEWILNALIITVILEQVRLEKSSQGRLSLILSFYFYKKNVFIYYHAINFLKRLPTKTELTLKTTLSLFPILLPRQHQPSTAMCVSTQPDPRWRPGRTKLRPSASQ